VVVVGGGLLGLATAYKLLRLKPDLDVVVVEKETAVGQHQSGHNSGVLHAGLYYAPGSAKARLAVAGVREMVGFCQQHRIPHDICGKVVVATTEVEAAQLRSLLERGRANGLAGIRWLSSSELREREPHASGVAAVLVPEEGIVDYPRVCATLSTLVQELGGAIRTGVRVTAITPGSNRDIVVAEDEAFEADFVVGCAGLYADRLAAMHGLASPARIVPFRGEYYRLGRRADALVRHLIYPVPDPSFPFLGVHFTRMIHGGVEAGPNALLVLGRESYQGVQLNVVDAASTLLFPGFWKFIARHPGATYREFRRSMSRALFASSLQRLVPDVTATDLVAGGAGVRAQAMNADGSLVNDFLFADAPRGLHVLNAPSPGATASLAIGTEIATRALARLG
jgi:L-2-hydroxyglutarate oxidase